MAHSEVGHLRTILISRGDLQAINIRGLGREGIFKTGAVILRCDPAAGEDISIR